MVKDQLIRFSRYLKQDYHSFQALKIRRNAIYFTTILLALFIFIELTVDLSTTNANLLLAFLIPNLILTAFISRTKNTYWFGHIQVFLFYLLIQVHIFYNPRFFHTLIFWMPIVPMLSIFLISFRASLVWLLITLLSIAVDTAYGQNTVGLSYIVEQRFIAYGTGGAGFVIGMYLTNILMYNLIGYYYLDVQEKREEISRLNKELSDLNQNLEQKVLVKVADIKAQNERLEKYSFMNAHIVRAPLANIIGAMQLYHQTEDVQKRNELLSMLEESAQKLDDAIQEVANDLSHHSN